MYTLKLRYCDTLLFVLTREMWGSKVTGRALNWPLVHDLCDRIERVLASIQRPPLVWGGDYA